MSRHYRNSKSGIRMVPVNTHDRTACEVLESVRKMVETNNFAGLKAAVEELQGMYERMEAALYFYDDIGYNIETIKRLDSDQKELKQDIKILRAKKWLIERDSDPNPKEDKQSEFNKGYKAGLDTLKKKEEE